MNLLLVSGFLGSGKTTFIIQLVKALSKKGLHPAIIVNEVGEEGIDDLLMRRLGLNVWELLGGCICCTIAGSLPETLINLESKYSPDLVIIEPTGAADPGNIIKALDYIKGGESLRKYHITLLDPLRMGMLMEILTPLTTSTIESSDLILVNKTDLASEEEIEYSLKIAHGINSEADIIQVSAKTGIDPELIEGLIECLK